ncbi:lipoprotein [[Acholeplasma] multilocale]|uniref:lipoprotein n=1 Tax=[Acholeplasma] multilocale TaxID=264638 RepID=UPI0004798A11|nr:lipoprotein [[Acholeplasma] multilocale]
MKKLLTILGAVTLTTSSAMAVVACSDKSEEDVIFMLPGIVASQTGKIAKAYEEMINDFNESNESDIKVQYRWKKEDPVAQDIAAGKALPDLYVAYPDSVSSISMGAAKNQIRDMQATIGYEEKELREKFIRDSFYEEGIIKDKLAVLPAAKSLAFTTVNLKLLIEMISKVVEGGFDNQIVKDLMTSVDEYNSNRTLALHDVQHKVDAEVGNLGKEKRIVTMETRFKDPEFGNKGGLKLQTAKTGKIFTKNAKATAETKEIFISKIISKLEGNVSVDKIIELLKDNDNYYILTKLYQELHNFSKDSSGKITYSDMETEQIRKMDKSFSESYVYAFGVDDSANRVYIQASKDSGITNLDATKDTHKDFLYELKDVNYEQRTGKVILNSGGSAGTTMKWFDEIAELAKTNRDNENDPRAKWRGAILPGKIENAYSSNFFKQGTMFASTSSSAGSWSMINNNSNLAMPQDIVAISNSTKSSNGEDFKADYFAQQGPGIAGFNSTGANKTGKEKVVTAFLQYMLSEKTLTKFSLQSGYIPSTKDAMNRYSYYVNGSFDNMRTGKFNPGATPPKDADTYEKIAEAQSDKTFSKTDILLWELVDRYLTDNKNTILVSHVPNPFGNIVRQAISNSIRTGVANGKSSANFISTLSGERNNNTILGQLHANMPGDLQKFTIETKK